MSVAWQKNGRTTDRDPLKPPTMAEARAGRAAQRAAVQAEQVAAALAYEYDDEPVYVSALEHDVLGGVGPPTFDMTDARCSPRGEYRHVSWFDSSQAAWARTVCDACPVKAPCLDYALSSADVKGTWGGTSEDMRADMRAGRPPRDVVAFVSQIGDGSWKASVRGFKRLADGKEIRVSGRSSPLGALAAVMKHAEGVPTAQRSIAELLRQTMAEQKRGGLPMPTRTNVDKDVDSSTSLMPNELQNVYSNWSK